MATSLAGPSGTKTLAYLLLGVLVLGVGALLVVGLYFGLSYVALNLFLSLDQSVYSLAGGPLGYVLLGLALGAAGGMLAAQRRFRLPRSLAYGAAALLLGAVGLAAVPGQARHPLAATSREALAYVAAPGRVSCAACTAITASTTRAPQNGNSYAAANLLRRDSTKAWISEVAADAENPLLPAVQLHLAVAPLAGHRLVGLRLRNGYCKSRGVYEAFGRVQELHLRLPTGEVQAWTLPDAARQEYFVPLAPGAPDSTRLTLLLAASYPGTSHAEVALAWLVPVFEPLKR